MINKPIVKTTVIILMLSICFFIKGFTQDQTLNNKKAEIIEWKGELRLSEAKKSVVMQFYDKQNDRYTLVFPENIIEQAKLNNLPLKQLLIGKWVAIGVTKDDIFSEAHYEFFENGKVIYRLELKKLIDREKELYETLQKGESYGTWEKAGDKNFIIYWPIQ